jgi:hypothetical protein
LSRSLADYSQIIEYFFGPYSGVKSFTKFALCFQSLSQAMKNRNSVQNCAVVVAMREKETLALDFCIPETPIPKGLLENFQIYNHTSSPRICSASVRMQVATLTGHTSLLNFMILPAICNWESEMLRRPPRQRLQDKAIFT